MAIAIPIGVRAEDLGTAAYRDVGVADGNVVEVEAGGLLPALDGSQLTNLPNAGISDFADGIHGLIPNGIIYLVDLPRACSIDAIQWSDLLVASVTDMNLRVLRNGVEFYIVTFAAGDLVGIGAAFVGEVFAQGDEIMVSIDGASGAERLKYGWQGGV